MPELDLIYFIAYFVMKHWNVSHMEIYSFFFAKYMKHVLEYNCWGKDAEFYSSIYTAHLWNYKKSIQIVRLIQKGVNHSGGK